MKSIAVFAGSFCPFTKGHEDIVQKALPLFDEVVVAIGHNANKRDLFSVEQRLAWLQQIYKDEPKVKIMSYEGLTVALCQRLGARYLIRGLRNASDYNMEEEMRLANRMLCPEIETIFIPASPQWTAVSSSLVRELWALGADFSPYLSYPLPERV